MIQISVILVVRNEQNYVLQCINSIEQQFTDTSIWELIVVDGGSTDNTLFLIKNHLSSKSYRSRIFNNPKRILSAGWNIGIQNADGKFVIRPDGHSILCSKYIITGIQTLDEMPEVIAVGGVLTTKSKGFWGEIISEALSTKIGVGNSSFRTSKKSTYTDTAVYAIYRKEIFSKVGLFNESMNRHQDNEMHHRISKVGGRFYLNIDMKAIYFSRDTISKLINQMFNIGINLPPVIVKGAASPRHVVPFLFYLFLCTSFLLGLFENKHFLFLGLIFLTIYITAILLEGIRLIFIRRSFIKILIIFIIPIMHVSYAGGTFIGFLKYITRYFFQRNL